MSGLCRTCVHWEPTAQFVTEWEPHPKFGRCSRIADQADQHEDELAATQDAEMYASWLSTKADFGCVLHEERA